MPDPARRGSRIGTSPRLLVLTPDFPPARGGIQLLIGRLVEGLEHHRVRVVTFAHPDADRFDRTIGAEVVRVARPGIPKAPNAMLNARSAQAALAWRPAAVLSAHIITSPAARLIRRLGGIPFVQYLHGNELAARPAMARRALRDAAAAIAVSRHTRELAVRLGAEPASVHCIPPGVDEPSPAPPPARAESRPPTIVTVARLTQPYKGHDVMIRALARVRESVPEARWLVVGDGPLRPALVELARERGILDAIEFAGEVHDAERDELLRRADVFAMPSRLPPGGGGEGFGIVYLEAAAHGLPVVAGEVGGAVDAVVDGETGVLVDPADDGAVAAALVSLLADPDRRQALGRAGAARARRFTWRAMSARVEDVLDEIVRRA